MIKQNNNSSILNNWTSAREKFTKGKNIRSVREGGRESARDRMEGVCFRIRVCVCVALSIMLIWIVWSGNCSYFAIHLGIIETIFSHSQSMFWIFVCLFMFFSLSCCWNLPSISSLKVLSSLRPENWNPIILKPINALKPNEHDDVDDGAENEKEKQKHIVRKNRIHF